jgi:hypothetical protein
MAVMAVGVGMSVGGRGEDRRVVAAAAVGTSGPFLCRLCRLVGSRCRRVVQGRPLLPLPRWRAQLLSLAVSRLML